MIAAALVGGLGVWGLGAIRQGWRYPLWEASARAQQPLFLLHRLHPTYAAAWSLWRDLDGAVPRTLAVTAGWDGLGHNLYLYPLLGSRLQNRVLYVPVTAGGEVIDHRDAERRKKAADFPSWLRRLQAARVDTVVSLAPRWTIEDDWMRARPDLFRPCGESGGHLHALFCLDRAAAEHEVDRPRQAVSGGPLP